MAGPLLPYQPDVVMPCDVFDDAPWWLIVGPRTWAIQAMTERDAEAIWCECTGDGADDNVDLEQVEVREIIPLFHYA